MDIRRAKPKNDKKVNKVIDEIRLKITELMVLLSRTTFMLNKMKMTRRM